MGKGGKEVEVGEEVEKKVVKVNINMVDAENGELVEVEEREEREVEENEEDQEEENEEEEREIGDEGAERGGEKLKKLTAKELRKEGKIEPETREEKEEIVKKCHEGNHVGANMMFQMIFREGYYWETLFKDCEEVAKKCIPCLKFNTHGEGFHPMRTINAKQPMDHVVWDLIGKLPTSGNGHNFVLIIIDVLSRFVLLRPLMTKRAKEIAGVMMQVFSDFGVPRIIQIDNDSALLNQCTREIQELAGFQFRNIMAYFPRTNGVVERWVQETKLLLAKVMKGDTEGWDYFIPPIQMALNGRVISRHNSRPFSEMFGRKKNGFEDYRKEVEMEETQWIEYVEKWGREIWEIILEKGSKRGKEICEKKNEKKKAKNKREELKVGDIVMKKKQRRKNKMSERWEGPFKIMEKEKEGYRLGEQEGRMQVGLFPIEYLKLIEEGGEEEREDEYEVEEVVDHRGKIE